MRTVIRHTGLALFCALSFWFISGCGLAVNEPNYLEVVTTSPEKGDSAATPFGPYYWVFNQRVTIADSSNLNASFSGSWGVSGETLWVARASLLPAYNSLCTLQVFELLREDGEKELVRQTLFFRTALGESEDNNSTLHPDTLGYGEVRFGELGGSGGTSDIDCFQLPDDSLKESSLILEVNETVPLYYYLYGASFGSAKCDAGEEVRLRTIRNQNGRRIILEQNGVFDTLSGVLQPLVVRIGSDDPYSGLGRLRPGARYRLSVSEQL